MVKWEYGELWVPTPKSLGSTIFGLARPTFTVGGHKREFSSSSEALAVLGAEGWDMVGQSQDSDSNWSYTTYTFKREAGQFNAIYTERAQQSQVPMRTVVQHESKETRKGLNGNVIVSQQSYSRSGLFGKIVIGIIGGLITVWLFSLLGLHIAGLLGSLIMFTIGAIGLNYVIGLIRK